MNNLKVRKFCCSLATFIVFSQPHAYVDKSAFDKLISESEIVAQVKINASKVTYEPIGDEVIKCGISYTINIIESFKGTLLPSSTITIFGWHSLKTDAEYLLFLTNTGGGALDGTPKIAKKKCMQHVSEVRISGSFFMEIIQDSEGKGHPNFHPPLLAKYEDAGFPIPPEMGMFTRNYEFCNDPDDIGNGPCHPWKTTSFLDWDKLSNYIRMLTSTFSN